MNDYSAQPFAIHAERPFNPEHRSHPWTAVRYALLAVLVFSGAYVLFSASTAVLITIAGVVVALVILLIAFGIWVQNNTPIS
jgi:hypothetical protein